MNKRKKLIIITIVIVVILGFGFVLYKQLIPEKYVPADNEIALQIQMDTKLY